MAKLVEMNKLSKFDQAKELYSAGRISWAVDIVEQEILSEKFKDLSDDDKESIHVWLYENGLKGLSSEQELLDTVNEFLDKQGERE